MFICTFDDCSASFNKKWKLIEHETKHTGIKPFVCTYEGCSKAFTRQPHLQRHMSSHSGEKNFFCEEEGCGAGFTNKDNLKRHIQRVHVRRKYKCEYEGCGKTFHKHQHLTIHQYVHTNIKPFKCEEEGCEASFLIPSKLKAHMKIHKGYTCTKEGCNEWFSKWSELNAHLATHTIEFPCTECSMVFNKKHKLRNHMLVHATEREVFVCPKDDCERRFMKRESLRLHISKFHEGSRPFSCSHPGCMKTFSYKKSLVQHQVVHEPGYQKPPPKPRKRRSLASRLSGHPDMEEPDLLSSPLHGLTFDIPDEDSPSGHKMDTELHEDISHPSSSGQTSPPARSSKVDSQTLDIPSTSTSGHACVLSESPSRSRTSRAVAKKSKSVQDETVCDDYARSTLLARQASEMDFRDPGIPSTSVSDEACMPLKISSRGSCSRNVVEKPELPQDEMDEDEHATNILLAMQGHTVHVT